MIKYSKRVKQSHDRCVSITLLRGEISNTSRHFQKINRIKKDTSFETHTTITLSVAPAPFSAPPPAPVAVDVAFAFAVVANGIGKVPYKGLLERTRLARDTVKFSRMLHNS